MKKKQKLNFRELARETGADRASIAKWCAGITERKEALQIIRSKKKEQSEKHLDPVSGLPWSLAKEKEQALKLRRLNEEEEKVRANEWMATATHHQVISVLVNQLEQLPGKAKSQLGLTSDQALQLQKMVDEVRTNAADQVDAEILNPKP